MPIYKMEGKKDGLQKYRVRINYIDRNGKSKQIDRVAYGKENAKELERQLNYDMKSGEATKSRMTVQQLYDEYIAVKMNEIRETTLRTHKGQLERQVLPYIKDVRLDKLNTRTLQCWKQSVEQYRTEKGEPFSIDYKQGIYKTFNTMLNYAVKMEYITKNLLPIVGNFKDAYSVKSQVDFYMPDEFKKFIEVAKEQAEKNDANVYEWNFYVFFNIA
ncbi:MAG: phage integrase SAM-like domain-containing protein, partial [Candidatus Ornithomonoglobus sp.]